jgi:ABC-type branched-subunit amino acid transport system ATPase component
MTDNYPTHILTIKNLSKRFGHVHVLKNVKLSLGLGEIYAIIGPNGAGKTTLFNLITNVIEKDTGKVIYYNGVNSRTLNANHSKIEEKVDITNFKAHEVARLGIGRTFQGNRVFSNMTVLENVMFAKQLIMIENPISIVKKSPKGIINQLKEKNSIRIEIEKIMDLERLLKKEAEYWLEYVDLIEKAENKAEELSYGQQKLLSIARLLMANSRMLLFDEPTAGVNPKYANRIAEIFKRIVKNGDKTILFIEHDMKFIQKLGCKCLYMEEGICPWPFFELEVIMNNEAIRRKFMGM